MMNVIKALRCCVVVAAVPAAACAGIRTSLRFGPYGEVTSKPFFDPGAGARTVLSIAGNGEIRLDGGVRRPQATASSGPLVGTATGSLQWNLLGGYPRNLGVVGGYQYFYGAEHGFEWLGGLGMATSLARGERVQYELSLGQRRLLGGRWDWVGRFKVVVLRLPLWFRKVPNPPPFTVVVDSVDAGGVPSNPRWQGGPGRNADKTCYFYYVKMSVSPLLVYRPECDTTAIATLNQPVSLGTAKHSGLSCSVKEVEPIIRGHINWFVVNQTGRLRWLGFNEGSLGDHDFNLHLEAPDLVTQANVRANERQPGLRNDPKRDSLIELEFSGDETTSFFSTQHGGALWAPLIALQSFKAETAGYHRENVTADSLFRGRFAVVTGVLGLDGEHGFHTELHPVLGMAADVSHKMRDSNAHAWLVLLRNMGNEGECAAGQLPWVLADTAQSKQYVLEIPWKVGADSVVVDTDSSLFGFVARRTPGLTIRVDRARAVRLVARLPQPTHPDSVGIVYGTLWLRWFAQGRPLPNDAGVVQVAGMYQTPRQAWTPDRDKADYEPVMMEAFTRSRPLCFDVSQRAEPVVRRPVPPLRPQIILRQGRTPAPPVVDEGSCPATPPS